MRFLRFGNYRVYIVSKDSPWYFWKWHVEADIPAWSYPLNLSDKPINGVLMWRVDDFDKAVSYARTHACTPTE